MPTYLGALPAHGSYRLDACSRCTRADNLIDTDVNIDYEGGVALCVGCVKDIALAAGIDVTGAKLKEAQARIQALEAELTGAREQVARVRGALRGAK